MGQPPIGEIIRLTIDSHLGNGGEPVKFASAEHRNGFAGNNFPTGQILLPHSAIYGIEGEIEWGDCYTGGGVVNLYLGEVLYDTFRGFTDAWTRFSFADEFDAQAGQRLSIEVVHDDTTTDHELHGHVTVATKEPLRTIVEQPVTFEFWTVDGDAASFSTALVRLSAEDGSVLEQTTWPDPRPDSGLVMVGSTMWGTDVLDENFDPDPSLHFWTPGDTSTTRAGLSFDPDGLAHDGTNFWTADESYRSANFIGRVMEVDSGGTILTTGVDTAYDSFLDLEWHDGALWGIGRSGSDDDLVRFNADGSIAEAHTLARGALSDTGLGSHGDLLYYYGVDDSSDQALIGVDTSGSEQSLLTISATFQYRLIAVVPS